MYNNNFQAQQPTGPIQTVGVPVPISVQELGDGFLKELERLAIENHTTKSASKLPGTIRFAVGTGSCHTFVQVSHGEKVVGCFPFINGEIFDIFDIEYSPDLGLEAGYFISVRFGKDAISSVFVPQKFWNGKKMLHAFQNIGVVFLSKRSESFHLSLLNNLIAEKSAFMTPAIVDPRPGWRRSGNGFTYWRSGHIPFAKVPTFVDCARLQADDISPGKAFADFLNALNPFLGKKFLHFLKSALGLGILYSLLTAPGSCAQETFLVCRGTASTRRQLLRLLSPVQDPDLPILSLTMPPKKVAAALDKYRDRPLAIDIDTFSASKYEIENLAQLRTYVLNGVCPSGQPASCLVIFLCTTLPGEIPLDNSLVVDFAGINLDHLVNPSNLAANFAQGLITYVMQNADVLTVVPEKVSHPSHLIRLLLTASHIVDNIFGRTLKNACADTGNLLLQLLTAAESNSCFFGISEAFLDCLIENLENGNLQFCKASGASLQDLEYKCLVTKDFLLISDEILGKFILPEISDIPLSPIVFRKQLEEDGFLFRSTSRTGKNSLKTRVRLKNGPGPWMTAIPLEALKNTYAHFDLDEILEAIL